MAKEDHFVWDEGLKRHINDKDCGCIWRHAFGWEEESKVTVCHYAMNSFNALDERNTIYNKNHKQRAKNLGYITDKTEKVSKKAKNEVEKVHKELENSKDLSEFLELYYGKHLGGPLRYLLIHEQGWWVGHTIDNDHVPKNKDEYKTKGAQVNFLPRKNEKKGGYGKWYPYFHEHHHILPQGAYRDYVIYATDEDIDDRIKISVTSGWNINDKPNMIMLPEEVMVGRIIQLPAHKFWGEFGHEDYSKSIKDDLREVQQKMQKAVDEKKPCEETEIKLELKDMLIAKSKMYYDKIVRMGMDESIDSLIRLDDERLEEKQEVK